MSKIILILLFIVILSSNIIKQNEGMKPINFCFSRQNKIKSAGFYYKVNCGHNLRTKDKKSCQSLTLFSELKNIQRNQKDKEIHMKKFLSFLSLIKGCPQLNARWTRLEFKNFI